MHDSKNCVNEAVQWTQSSSNSDECGHTIDMQYRVSNK